MKYRNIVRYEFIERILKNPDYDSYLEIVEERLMILQSFKELTIDQKSREITLNENIYKYNPNQSTFSYLKFFSGLLDHIFDTYLIVGLALQEVCSGNHIIKESRLVNEIHKALI